VNVIVVAPLVAVPSSSIAAKNLTLADGFDCSEPSRGRRHIPVRGSSLRSRMMARRWATKDATTMTFFYAELVLGRSQGGHLTASPTRPAEQFIP